ncbi:MAG: CPBP family intramembrane metalloprotease [Acidobacteriia bacterium]|nr:CPBP family intramembrane metalloprotease [Terriglobia bacterium]
MIEEQPPPAGAPPPEFAPPPEPPPEPPPAPPPERYPFWGYSDLFLFAGLAIPSMLLGLGLVKLVMLLFHLHAPVRAVELLPEQFAGYAILFTALLVMFRMQYGRPFWRSLAWTGMRFPLFWIVVAGVVTAYAVALLAVKLIHVPEAANPMTKLLEDRTSVLLMAAFGLTVAPLSEELAFRGFLQPLLVRSLGAAPGIVAAAIPFGLLHYQEYGDSWRHALLIFIAGAAFGWMRHATGSTRASTLMHASYNAVFFAALFAQRKDLPHAW